MGSKFHVEQWMDKDIKPTKSGLYLCYAKDIEDYNDDVCGYVTSYYSVNTGWGYEVDDGYLVYWNQYRSYLMDEWLEMFFLAVCCFLICMGLLLTKIPIIITVWRLIYGS